MIGVECPQCDGTGTVPQEIHTGYPDFSTPVACPGPHVVLETAIIRLVDGDSGGPIVATDDAIENIRIAERTVVRSDRQLLYADPECLMWWCADDRFAYINQDYCEVSATVDGPLRHEGCGWVPRPTVTWKEAEPVGP